MKTDIPKHPPFRPRQDLRLEPVYRLAENCEYEVGHAHQVTRLALRLFDELTDQHRLEVSHRYELTCAGLLHDIGWLEGGPKHHKTTLRYILDSPLLPWDERYRLVIGSIARYHRKALPKQTHDHFAALSCENQTQVRILSGLLRVADALDYSHRSVVRGMWCQMTTPGRLVIRCQVVRPAEPERQKALQKADLLRSVLEREIEVEWVLP